MKIKISAQEAITERTSRKFHLKERVRFINCGAELNNRTGIVLGQAARHAEFSQYIVLLDIPMEDRLAVDITEHCLASIED